MLNIIIPTLNAENSITQTLAAVFAHHLPDLNVVVVDGGSTDGTQLAAQESGAKVIECAPGRGRQLAFGAANTSGQWLLFLHADTVLPSDWEDHVRRYIAVALNVQKAAYFQLRFDDRSAGATRVAMLANWRAKAWGLPYGDQGLLIHRTLYDEVGGYPADLQLMEDVHLVQRLGPMRVEALYAYVTTSAAKYRTGGWFMRPLRNMICLGLYFVGAPNRWIESLNK
ncbi:MAG: TIGR04283 family arsenosugar biosynthesis glycosyltransferase [Magnetovibrio sp.]|nr:TIGR04283 family arsenosugar biosynthesis glycosyltransferase [Magnetovibrio sp.]